LSEGHVVQRGRKRDRMQGNGASIQADAPGKKLPGRNPRRKDRKPVNGKSGKSKKGKSW